MNLISDAVHSKNLSRYRWEMDWFLSCIHYSKWF